MTSRRIVDKQLKRERDQVLEDIGNAALTLSEPLQRDLNARLRELVQYIAKVRAEHERKMRPPGR